MEVFAISDCKVGLRHASCVMLLELDNQHKSSFDQKSTGGAHKSRVETRIRMRMGVFMNYLDKHVSELEAPFRRWKPRPVRFLQ